jgi:hypothetical protein
MQYNEEWEAGAYDTTAADYSSFLGLHQRP